MTPKIIIIIRYQGRSMSALKLFMSLERSEKFYFANIFNKTVCISIAFQYFF